MVVVVTLLLYVPVNSYNHTIPGQAYFSLAV